MCGLFNKPPLIPPVIPHPSVRLSTCHSANYPNCSMNVSIHPFIQHPSCIHPQTISPFTTHLSVYPPIYYHLSSHLPATYPSISQPVSHHSSIHLPTHLSTTHKSIYHLSICHLLIRLPVHPSIRLPIHPHREYLLSQCCSTQVTFQSLMTHRAHPCAFLLLKESPVGFTETGVT